MNGCAVCRTPSDALSGGLCERCHGEVDRWQHDISESLSRMEAMRNGVSGLRKDHSARYGETGHDGVGLGGV